MHSIRAEHLDHAPFTIDVLVPAAAEVRVDMALALRPVALPAVLARNHLIVARRRHGSGGGTRSRRGLGQGARSLAGHGRLGLGAATRGGSGTPGTDPADPSSTCAARRPI